MVTSVVRVWKAGNGYAVSIPQNVWKSVNYKVGDLIEVEFKTPIGKSIRKKKKIETKEIKDLEEVSERLPEIE